VYIIQRTLGSADEPTASHLFAPRETVSLGFTPSRVHVFLRGFDAAYHGDDNHLHRLQVSVEWVSGATPSTVDVIARGALLDHGGPDRIRLAIHYTLVAE
jgi:hypothetical protein